MCDIKKEREQVLNIRNGALSLDHLKKDTKFTLLIGSGITGCIAGDWNTLLTEVALRQLRSKVINGKISSPDIESYLKKTDNFLIPPDTDVLQKGEYLMFDPYDSYASSLGTFPEENWRETFFAAQVKYSIEALKKKNLPISKLDGHQLTEKETILRAMANDPDEDNPSRYRTLIESLHLCVSGKVSDVIIYNFDTIFDRLINDVDIWESFRKNDNKSYRKKKVLVFSYFSADPIPLKDFATKDTGGNCIRIYHVHGLLDPEFDEVHPIIFSENSYQTYQKTLLNWSNLKLSEAVMKSDILCVGFSGIDANFRQMMRFMMQVKGNPVFSDVRKRNTGVYLIMECGNIAKSYMPDDLADDEIKIGRIFLEHYLVELTTYFRHQYGIELLVANGFDEYADMMCSLC